MSQLDSLVPRTAKSMSRSEWVLVILLVVSVLVNYVDRTNLSIAAPVLQKQLSLSPLQVGSLLSAFFWTYAFLQIAGIAGWLSDRFPASIVLMWGYILWSGVTIATGFLSSFVLLYLARLALGVGESIAYPCYSRIFVELPQHHRGRANALIDAGTKLGPAAGTFIGGLLLIHFGWRVLFIALGAAGLLWLIPWVRSMPVSRRAATEGPSVELPSTLELLRVPSAWGTFLGHFCGNYFFYFLLAWLPLYLVRERNFSLSAMTRLTSALFLVIATSTILAGWASDYLIEHGISATRARKSIAVGGLSVASTLTGLPFIEHRDFSIALLFLACAGYGAYASQHWAISQTLAGPAMAGRWTSVQNGVGNLSGIVAPWLAGAVVQFSGSSRPAFLVSGIVALAGAVIWGFLVRRVEEVAWAKPAPPVAALGS
jgi:MFS transporter, ACS family, D-galactonate transporter